MNFTCLYSVFWNVYSTFWLKLTKKEIYIILFYKIKDQFLKKEKRLKTDFNKIELLL